MAVTGVQMQVTPALRVRIADGVMRVTLASARTIRNVRAASTATSP
jgi:hypothetical protein